MMTNRHPMRVVTHIGINPFRQPERGQLKVWLELECGHLAGRRVPGCDPRLWPKRVRCDYCQEGE